MMINAQARYLMSPSIFAMCPNICAKEFGIIPRSSGTIRTPSIVNVLPVPVCPYAKIVPGKIESKNNNSHQECKKKVNSTELVLQASSFLMLLAKSHLPSKKIFFLDYQTDFRALLTPSRIPLQQLSVGLHSLDHLNIPPGGDWERVYSQLCLCTTTVAG